MDWFPGLRKLDRAIRPRLKKKYKRMIWLSVGIVLGLILPLPRWLVFGISVLWFLAVGWSRFRYLPFLNWHASWALAGKITEHLLKSCSISLVSLGLALSSWPLGGGAWIIGLLLLGRYGKDRCKSVIWPLCLGESLPGAPSQYWFRPSGLGDVIRLTDVWIEYTRSGSKPPVKIMCNASIIEIIGLLVGRDHVEVWEDFEWLGEVKKGARIIDLRQTTELDNRHSHAHTFAKCLHLLKPRDYLIISPEIRQRKELDTGKVWILLCGESSNGSRTLTPQAMLSLIESLLSYYPNLGILISGRKKNQVAMQHERLRDISGKLTLIDLLSFMNTADGIITTDNGSLHMGLALEKPLFVYFSTMPAWKVLPAQARNVTCSEYKDPCAPCFNHGELCPVTASDDFPCMQTFPLEDVHAWMEATFALRLGRCEIKGILS